MTRDDPGEADGDEDDTWSSAVPELEFDDVEFEQDPTAPFPLPPEDRLWRHPSELKYLRATSATTPSETEPRTMSLRTSLGMIALAAAIGAGAASATFVLAGPRDGVVVERVVERQTVASAGFATAISTGSTDISEIAESVTPAIVRVELISSLGQPVSSGSGVMFRDDGHVITNAHVLAGGNEIRVIMADGRELSAEIIGTDELTDIAVIRADPTHSPFQIATLGTTVDLRAGQQAIAIGSPLRLQGGPTVTVGVVSATHRQLRSPQGDWLFDLVQTDAPISPGSSGGALLDSRGSVIGITTVIAVSEVGAEGLGFAIPIEIARSVATDLLNHGSARHGRLGIEGASAPMDMLPEGWLSGVEVHNVEPGGPAETAGLARDDLIVGLDDTPVKSMADLVVKARLLDPGESVTIHLLRDGRLLELKLVVGQLE